MICGAVGNNMRHLHWLQTRPPRGRKTSLEEAPRIATIHEYLDWTVTAEDALRDNDLVRALVQAVKEIADPQAAGRFPPACMTCSGRAIATAYWAPSVHYNCATIGTQL